MSYLNQNIRHLRQQKGYTQDILAGKVGIKRSLIGAYEEHRAEPKIATMQKLVYLFGISLDDLINTDLSKGKAQQVDTQGKTLRVLPIAVGADGKERIAVVPVTARAGYAHSYADPEYIGELPHFALPLQELYQDQTMRLFQISGESMLPVPSGSYVISSYVENWDNVKEGHCHIIITRDSGVVYKRIHQHNDSKISLVSDNSLFEPYDVALSDIVEIWSAHGFISLDLPHVHHGESDIQHLSTAISRIQQDVSSIKHNLNIDP